MNSCEEPHPMGWDAQQVERWVDVNISLKPEGKTQLIRGLRRGNIDGATLFSLPESPSRLADLLDGPEARDALLVEVAKLRYTCAMFDHFAALKLQEELLSLPEKEEVDEEVVRLVREEVEAMKEEMKDFLWELRADSEEKRNMEDHLLAEQMERDLLLATDLGQVEEMETADRRLAFTLAGREPPPQPNPYGRGSQMVVHEEVRAQEGETDTDRRRKAKGKEKIKDNEEKEKEEGNDEALPAGTCDICREERQVYEMGCNHLYCKDCTRQLLRSALDDITLLPLRCCKIEVGVAQLLHLLPLQERQKFIRLNREHESKNWMFCPVPSCSTFIPLDFFAEKQDEGEDIIDPTLTCPNCRTLLCGKCKKKAHLHRECLTGKDTEEAKEDQEVLNLAGEEGWKRCPGCGAVIQHLYGCNHMTCVCKKEFCYQCRAIWRTCNCPLWNEDMLMGHARRIARDEGGGRRMQAALTETLANLLRHGECEHDWERTAPPSTPHCTNCHYKLWVYGMRCSRCRMVVCYTCARFRVL